MTARPRFTRRSFLRRSVLLGAGSALLMACQQSSPAPAPKAEVKPTEAPKPAVQPTAAPAAAAQPAPTSAPAQAAPSGRVRGGSITIAQELDPVSLDPHKTSNFSAVQGFEHVYESLTQYDEKLNVQPALAERWEVSPDGMQYTFLLRKEV